jgi:hypothetical protein
MALMPEPGTRLLLIEPAIIVKLTSSPGSILACDAPMPTVVLPSGQLLTQCSCSLGRISSHARCMVRPHRSARCFHCPLKRFAGDYRNMLANEVADSGGILGMTTSGGGGQAASAEFQTFLITFSALLRNGVSPLIFIWMRPAIRRRGRWMQ